MGEWNVTASQNMVVDNWNFFIGEPDKTPIENYFEYLKIQTVNTSDSTITHDYNYPISMPEIIYGGTWKFTLKGIPKAGVDFSTLETSKIAIRIAQFIFMPVLDEPVEPEAPTMPDPTATAPDPATGIPTDMPAAPSATDTPAASAEIDMNVYDLTNIEYAKYFHYDNKTFSFGGMSITSSDYVPDASDLPPTRAVVLSIKDKNTKKDIAGKIKREEIHIYGPNDSTSEISTQK